MRRLVHMRDNGSTRACALLLAASTQLHAVGWSEAGLLLLPPPPERVCAERVCAENVCMRVLMAGHPSICPRAQPTMGCPPHNRSRSRSAPPSLPPSALPLNHASASRPLCQKTKQGRVGWGPGGDRDAVSGLLRCPQARLMAGSVAKMVMAPSLMRWSNRPLQNA